jgi:hypothetical protein
LFLALFALDGCDRGASGELQGARAFADAVSRNDTAKRNAMIATYKFREYFENPFVASDMMSWFRTFYDYKERRFHQPAGADVDRDLKADLEGSLIDTAAIEATGVVKVKSPNPGEESAIFWMVQQHGRPWKVAIVTKGELQVNFH